MTAAGILRFIVVVVRWKLPQERRFGLPGVGGHEMRWSERGGREVCFGSGVFLFRNFEQFMPRGNMEGTQRVIIQPD